MICSIYENYDNDKKYLAALKNFIDITPRELEAVPDTVPDTIWSRPDTSMLILKKGDTDIPPFFRKKIPSFSEVMGQPHYVDVATIIAKSKTPIFVDSATFLNSIVPDEVLQAFGIINEYGIPIHKLQSVNLKKIKVRFSDGSIAEIDKSDSPSALLGGAKRTGTEIIDRSVPMKAKFDAALKKYKSRIK